MEKITLQRLKFQKTELYYQNVWFYELITVNYK